MNVHLHNADCREVLAGLGAESVDCVVTDPPYAVNSAGGSGRFRQGIFAKPRGTLFRHQQIKFAEWLPLVWRVLKPGTHCYAMVNARNLADLVNAGRAAGFAQSNILVWRKNNQTMHPAYMQRAEFIVLFSKRPARMINHPGSASVIDLPNILGKTAHPTEKPVDLMAHFIANSTNRGDSVLDPFLGVGATALAAMQLGRECIGIEIDPQYFRIAQARCAAPQQRDLCAQGEAA